MIYNGDEGFDSKFSTGGMWGRAVYFAVDSSYSDKNYKFKLPNGQFQMFYARVIVGNYELKARDEKITMPGLLPGNIFNRYDSIKGQTHGCDVYMIYSNK